MGNCRVVDQHQPQRQLVHLRDLTDRGPPIGNGGDHVLCGGGGQGRHVVRHLCDGRAWHALPLPRLLHPSQRDAGVDRVDVLPTKCPKRTTAAMLLESIRSNTEYNPARDHGRWAKANQITVPTTDGAKRMGAAESAENHRWEEAHPHLGDLSSTWKPGPPQIWISNPVSAEVYGDGAKAAGS